MHWGLTIAIRDVNGDAEPGGVRGMPTSTWRGMASSREEEARVTDSFMGRCGIDCEACEHRTRNGCPGCPAADGKLFWGDCRLANCCAGKGHDHCGQCGEFPCTTLNEFAYDREEGDNGQRILNLRAWNEIGYDAWRRTQESSRRGAQ